MRVILAALTVLIAAPAVKAETLALATEGFREELLPEARISGRLVAGVQHQGPPAGAVSVAAYVPRAWAAGLACARVVSVDGTYEAASVYVVPADWAGGRATLPYPTRYGERLGRAPADGIALRLSKGGCDAPPEELAVADWNDGADRAPAILVNSFQADTVFAYLGQTTQPIQCRPVELDGRSAYDMRCPLEGLSGEGSVTVDLLRVIDGQAAPKTSVILHLPRP
jgi:hypothetical protein